MARIIRFLCTGAFLYVQFGRGLSPGNLEQLFGPQMALAYQLDAISQGPKNSRFPGPNLLQLALVMDLHASKNIKHGAV
jgi:hypothetical protein